MSVMAVLSGYGWGMDDTLVSHACCDTQHPACGCPVAGASRVAACQRMPSSVTCVSHGTTSWMGGCVGALSTLHLWAALGLRLHQYRLLITIKPARGVPWCPNQSIKQRRQGESMQPSCCKRVLQHNQQVPLCAWVVCLCSSAVQPCRSVAPWCVVWCCSAAIKRRSRPMFLTLYVLWGAVNVIICIVWGC